MIRTIRYTSWVTAACVALLVASATPVFASPPHASFRPTMPTVNLPTVRMPTIQTPTMRTPTMPTTTQSALNQSALNHSAHYGSQPIGRDWWRIYPWSPYNAWRNPYWYPPYNNYYPFPPRPAYPYPYPMPQPYPTPLPWGGIDSGNP